MAVGVHFSTSMQSGGRPVLVAQALTGCSRAISVRPGRGREDGDADDAPLLCRTDT